MSHVLGNRVHRVCGLYAIIDSAAHPDPRSLQSAARAAEDSGAAWIQLRLKSLSDRERYTWACACCEGMTNPAARLWINDHVELAAILPVCGVHLGQEDLDPAVARKILPADRLVGQSTHNQEQVEEAERSPAVDVVAIGPILATVSKANPDPAVGWSGLAAARERTSKPLVAIGGLGAATYLEARNHGADLVAMIAALGRGAEVGDRCRELVRIELGHSKSAPRADDLEEH